MGRGWAAPYYSTNIAKPAPGNRERNKNKKCNPRKKAPISTTPIHSETICACPLWISSGNSLRKLHSHFTRFMKIFAAWNEPEYRKYSPTTRYRRWRVVGEIQAAKIKNPN